MSPVPYVQVDFRPAYALFHTAHGDVRLPRDLAPVVADVLLGGSDPACQRAILSDRDLRVSWPSASMTLPVVQAPILAHLLRDWAVA